MVVEHHESYREQLKSMKQELRDTEAMILKLKARAQAEDDIILGWETRDRLAQALNNWYIQDPNIRTEYNLLGDEGCGYLPHVLSAWALWYGCDPATRFQMPDYEDQRYQRTAFELHRKDLADAVDTIWEAIPALDRSLMIAMWLGRRSCFRSHVVRPQPAAWEGQMVINSDPQLSVDEKNRAQELIPRAMDRRNQPLFT